MTLTKRLAIGVLAFLLVIFFGTYIITVHNARNYFIKQLENNAQDTATSLGLSMSQSLRQKDLPTMLAMVEAIFDRGYFEFIEVRDNKGNLLISRRLPQTKSSAPQWFIHLIEWPSTIQTSLVMDGWRQVGRVLVSSDTTLAYEALWENAVKLFNWYVVFAVIALILVYLFIQTLLRPLKRVSRQAMAISDHKFPIETKIPSAPELKQVTLAMNQMVLKIKSLFEEQWQEAEELRKQVYQDSLTGLSNRAYFMQQLHSLLDNKDEFVPGYLVMVVLEGLEKYNHQYGYQKGDELLCSVANACKNFWQFSSTNTVARINGTTFAIIEQDSDAVHIEKKCKEFEQILGQLFSDVTHCEFHMAAASYFVHQTPSNLLSLLDTAVKHAKEKGVFYCKTTYEDFTYPRQLLSQDILDALEHKKILLYWQPVTDGKDILHYEIFVRLIMQNSDEVGAGYFIPIAERFEMAHLIDLYVLDELIPFLKKNMKNISLNLSKTTLTNKIFADNYLKKLAKIPAGLRKHINLEFQESFIIDSFTDIKWFMDEAKRLSVGIGMDRVGIHFSSMHYISDLHLDYVKLHGSLIQDIKEDESKQFFIHYFNKMAKTLEIDVVVTQVEHQSQWDALRLIHISWGQGRYLGSVEPLQKST